MKLSFKYLCVDFSLGYLLDVPGNISQDVLDVFDPQRQLSNNDDIKQVFIRIFSDIYHFD